LPKALQHASRADFLAGLRAAKRDVEHAEQICEDYQQWVDRLQPYFEVDPTLTVVAALERYERDHEALR